MKTRTMRLSILLAVLSFAGCGDPLSDRENIEKLLINEPLSAGKYSVFWDGTDNEGQFVDPGKYVAVLYSRNFTYVDTLTVLSGTSGKSNQNDHHHNDTVLQDALVGNTPDPFHVKDGTNIVFHIRMTIPIRLTIETP